MTSNRPISLLKSLHSPSLTSSASHPGKAPQRPVCVDRSRNEVKKARSHRLLALNDEHGRLSVQQFLGETVQVLIEQFRHDYWEGLTDNYLRVEIHALPDRIQGWQHTLVNAHLTHLLDDGVYGIYAE